MEILKLVRGFGWLLVSLFLAFVGGLIAFFATFFLSLGFNPYLLLVLFVCFFLGFFFTLIRWDGKQAHAISNAKLGGIALFSLVALVSGPFSLVYSIYYAPPSDYGDYGDPVGVMIDGLRNVQAKGFGITAGKRTVFEKDALILKGSLTQVVSIADEELRFACGGTTICNVDNLEVTGNGSSISVHRKIKATIVVCGDDSKLDNPKYCVGVGLNAEDARTACTLACGIA